MIYDLNSDKDENHTTASSVLQKISIKHDDGEITCSRNYHTNHIHSERHHKDTEKPTDYMAFTTSTYDDLDSLIQ